MPSGKQEIEQPGITCPKCGSTDWRCWDERTFDCWDADGWQCGSRVVGYLACNACNASWTDVSVDGSDENCVCDDD